MNAPSQQHVTWKNHQNLNETRGVSTSPTCDDEKLWGSKVRRIMGNLQIICGVIEFALGIAVIIIDEWYYFSRMDYVGWGIWNGVFAIVTGFLGVSSSKNKCKVIAYTVCSIIVAVHCAGCCVYAGFGVANATYYDYLGDQTDNLAIYIILCIVFFTQMVVSIIGASFTCGAVCSMTSQPQQVVYYNPQSLPQQLDPTPPYTVDSSQSGLTSQTTTVNGIDADVSVKT